MLFLLFSFVVFVDLFLFVSFFTCFLVVSFIMFVFVFCFITCYEYYLLFKFYFGSCSFAV